MKSEFSIIFVSAIASVMAQSNVELLQSQGHMAALCPRITQFNACQMEAATAITACSSKVVDVPDVEFWSCICLNTKEMQRCYQICNDDPNMQLQYQSQMANTVASCDYVEYAKAQGEKSISVSATATATLANGQTVAVPIAKAKPMPPKPTQPSNSRPAGGPVQIASDTSSISASLSGLLMAAAGLLAAI